MAFIRCGVSGGNGQSTTEEVTLWENPDTTANFTTTDVTLTDDISNYTALRFEYKMQASADDTTLNAEIYQVDKFKTYIDGGGFVGSLISIVNTYWYCRYIRYVDDTTITISRSIRLWANNSYSEVMAMPVRIVGIK